MALKTSWEIADALVTTIDSNVAGMHPYHLPVAQMETPFCFPLFSEEPHANWPDRASRMDCQLVVGVGWAEHDIAHVKLLLHYTALSGTRSIPAALMDTSGTANSLGGVVTEVRVGLIEPPMLEKLGSVVFLGRRINLTITPLRTA